MLVNHTSRSYLVKAIQMTEQGRPEVLRLVDLPDPVPGPGQVLISVEAAAVNFSDVMRRRGDVYPIPTRPPFVPGAEVAGTVAAVDEGVDNFEIGTPVFGIVGADASGGYAELALALRGQLGRGSGRAPAGRRGLRGRVGSCCCGHARRRHPPPAW
jgi:NADPH:quinone reductase-like Zn-dependent oxidoreductase